MDAGWGRRGSAREEGRGRWKELGFSMCGYLFFVGWSLQLIMATFWWGCRLAGEIKR